MRPWIGSAALYETGCVKQAYNSGTPDSERDGQDFKATLSYRSRKSPAGLQEIQVVVVINIIN